MTDTAAPDTNVPVITIDGPGGSGKGTIALRVAEHLGWHLLDSGALYRVTAHACAVQGVDLTDHPAVAAVARSLEVRFDEDGDGSFDSDDCEPSNAVVHPAAPEICDGLDNNCNGETDEPSALFEDDVKYESTEVSCDAYDTCF